MKLLYSSPNKKANGPNGNNEETFCDKVTSASIALNLNKFIEKTNIVKNNDITAQVGNIPDFDIIVSSKIDLSDNGNFVFKSFS